MRDCRCEALQSLNCILLIEYLTFQTNLVYMLGHILKVDCDCGAAQVRYLFSSYHGELFYIYWLGWVTLTIWIR